MYPVSRLNCVEDHVSVSKLSCLVHQATENKGHS